MSGELPEAAAFAADAVVEANERAAAVAATVLKIDIAAYAAGGVWRGEEPPDAYAVAAASAAAGATAAVAEAIDVVVVAAAAAVDAAVMAEVEGPPDAAAVALIGDFDALAALAALAAAAGNAADVIAATPPATPTSPPLPPQPLFLICNKKTKKNKKRYAHAHAHTRFSKELKRLTRRPHLHAVRIGQRRGGLDLSTANGASA
ncbi:hypothetical protein RF55_16229 [Lasius niger]|uniref:Uncharacterized protein n=1 Tax=Lasius niger TaxID=67767 RepID=A0A0J7MXZ8_LASNI|nr:hypothetical protein RF55_16229 [Lasius niger]